MITLQSVIVSVFALGAIYCAWRKQLPGFVFLIGVAAFVAFAT